MSVTTLARSGLSGVRSRRTAPTPFAPWQPPSDWLALPAVNPGDKKFVGLYAVYDSGSNFVAFTASAAYTVDWGDGSATENINAGVQANHNYSFAALSAGTLTSGGYKQAIVTITPQGAGNLTALNLTIKHTQSGLANGTSTGWLDIRMASANMTSLVVSIPASVVTHKLLQRFEYVGVTAMTAGLDFSTCPTLQAVVGTAWTAGFQTFQNMFLGCSSLQTIPLLDTSAGANFQAMFSGCSSLLSVPLLNMAGGGPCTNMFLNCSSLKTIPLLNTAAVTNFTTMFSGCASLLSIPLLKIAVIGANLTGMFSSCSSLKTIPLLNTAASTTFTSMFSGCVSLQTIPLLNTAAGTSFAGMFQACTALQSIPLLNTAAGTSFQSMFQSCSALKSIPLLNTAAGTTFQSMFQGCSSLQNVPLLNTAAGLSFASMFNACISLATIPLLNTAAGTNFSSMFNGCTSLIAVPLLNVAAASSSANLGNMFLSCASLSMGALSGARFAISYISCRLSPTELNRIYTNLGTASGAQAITVTSNWGTTADDPTIATAKGWTVTGS